MDLQKNRGVKMTIIGSVVASVVRAGLCFVPQVPSDVADKIFLGILGMFGTYVGGQKFADGMSKGATSKK